MNNPRACEHKAFKCTCTTNRIEDIGAFVLDVTIECTQCGEPFQFLGLPAGLNFNSPTISIDGLTVHLPVLPNWQKESPLQKIGREVKKH